MNYKEVFELAKKKGYRLYFEFYGFEDQDGKPYRRMVLIEATLIQDWLRNDHKRYVDVVTVHHPYMDKVDFRSTSMGTILVDSYEEALLRGIYETLKLIS